MLPSDPSKAPALTVAMLPKKGGSVLGLTARPGSVLHPRYRSVAPRMSTNMPMRMPACLSMHISIRHTSALKHANTCVHKTSRCICLYTCMHTLQTCLCPLESRSVHVDMFALTSTRSLAAGTNGAARFPARPSRAVAMPAMSASLARSRRCRTAGC